MACHLRDSVKPIPPATKIWDSDHFDEWSSSIDFFSNFKIKGIQENLDLPSGYDIHSLPWQITVLLRTVLTIHRWPSLPTMANCELVITSLGTSKQISNPRRFHIQIDPNRPSGSVHIGASIGPQRLVVDLPPSEKWWATLEKSSGDDFPCHGSSHRQSASKSNSLRLTKTQEDRSQRRSFFS